MPIKFTLDKREDFMHECAIRLSWTFEKERCQTTIGIRIKKDNWNPVAQQVRENTHNNDNRQANDINALLRRMKKMATSAESISISTGKKLWAMMMKKAVKDILRYNDAKTEDIAANALNPGAKSYDTEPKFYRYRHDKYYSKVCVAYNDTKTYKSVVLRELFPPYDYIVVGEGHFTFKTVRYAGKVSEYMPVPEEEAIANTIYEDQE